MAAATHLLFSLRGHLFAIDTSGVREVVRLPALEPLAETPPHVVGLMDLRGSLVPIVDLALRMGYEAAPPQLSQAVVLLSRESALTGVIVDRVEGLHDVDASDVEPAPEAPAGVVASPGHVVTHVARVGDRLATLLDIEDVLFRLRPEDTQRPGGELAPRQAELSPQARETLRERARRLAQPVETEELGEAPAFILVRIGGEEFAVPAHSALEFVRVGELAPIPCCPQHIAGHVSLRGDVLVVVDLRSLLRLQGARPQEGLQAMLVRSPQGAPFAILLDAVLDVIEARESEHLPHLAEGSNYMRGTVRSDERRVPVLDVDRIAATRELVVKEDA